MLKLLTPKLMGQRIAHLRRNRGLSQAKLARKLGLSRGYLSDIERGRKQFTVKTLYHLAHKLDVRADYIVGVHTAWV